LIYNKIKNNKKLRLTNFQYLTNVYILICYLLIGLLTACGGSSNDATTTEIPQPKIENQESTTPLPDSTLIKNKARNIILILKNTDWRTLATHAHPTEGIRFSPYADVNADNLNFKKEDLINIDTTKIYVWGVYDGSGSPIRRTFPQYYREFIYDVDFLEKSNITYNQFNKYGNIYNTIEKIYPNALNVEYYISNIDPHLYLVNMKKSGILPLLFILRIRVNELRVTSYELRVNNSQPETRNSLTRN